MMNAHFKAPFAHKVKIVQPWEELQFQKNQRGLGYTKDMDNLLHFLNYCKLVQFVSGGFLNDDKKTILANNDQQQVQYVDTMQDDDAHAVDDDKLRKVSF